MVKVSNIIILDFKDIAGDLFSLQIFIYIFKSLMVSFILKIKISHYL